jgi:FKBP-type peptidyl-prolyl cis-trans isomerase SlyD
MKIVKNSVVTVRYTLTDAEDNLIEEGQEPMVYLHGGYDNIFLKLKKPWMAKKPALKPACSWSRKMRSATTMPSC